MLSSSLAPRQLKHQLVFGAAEVYDLLEIEPSLPWGTVSVSQPLQAGPADLFHFCAVEFLEHFRHSDFLLNLTAFDTFHMQNAQQDSPAGLGLCPSFNSEMLFDAFR